MAKYMPGAEQVLALFGAPASSESSGAMLPFLDDQSMFPYTARLRFVERIYNLHGTSGIDRAYRDLPRSTPSPRSVSEGAAWRLDSSPSPAEACGLHHNP